MEVIKKIGSHDGNDIVIKNKNIAAFHAELRMTVGRHFYITDLNAPQGTFINNEQLEGTRKLKPSDLVCFGDHNFYWEEHYPDFLDRNGHSSAQPKHDALLDDFEEEITLDISAGEEDEGFTGLKRILFNLRNPVDRQKIKRAWMLVLSIIMLLSIVFPQLSWGHSNVAYLGFDGKDAETFSGVQFIMEILDKDFDAATIFEVFTYLMFAVTLLMVAISAVYFFLIGINQVKPKTHLAVKGLSLTVVLCYAVIALNQLFYYVRFAFSDDYRFRFQKNDISIENLGIGFWLCFLAAILVYKSVRNGLWQQSFQRKWVTLSFSFWIPVLLLLVFMHGKVGLLVQKVDTQKFAEQFGNVAPKLKTDFKMKERIPQNGPLLLTSTYYFQINELKKNNDASRSSFTPTVTPKMEKVKSSMQWLWGFLNIYLIALVLLLFIRKVQSNVTVALAILLILVSFGLMYELNSLIDLNGGDKPDSGISMHIGWVLHLSVVGAIGMLVEQLMLRRKAN